MSKRMMRISKMTVLAVALLAVYGPAFAEDDQENSVSIGVGNWSKDRPQRGIYDGMRDSGAYLLLDADMLKRDDATGTWLGLKARNLGLDNRELKGEWQRQGDIGGSLEYSSITRDDPKIYNTQATGIGTTLQSVPVVSTAPNSGTNVELGLKRERLTAKFFKNLGVGFKFNASFRNEEKDGTRQWGRGGQPEFAVEPLNTTIRLLEATLSYSHDRLQLSGGYYGTQFLNANSMVITNGTASLPNTPAQLNLTLPLDNQSHELFLNGGYNFTPTTRGTFKASYSRATQNEFLPTAAAGLTWCATCTPSALSPSSLNGRLDTTLMELGLTAKPLPKLSVVANLRYRDFNDKTPLVGVVYIGTTPTVFNTPFSYTNKIGKVEATYRLPQSYSLLGGVEYNSQDRWAPSVGTLYVPFSKKLDETTYRVQLRKSMSETVNGSLAYAYSKRDGNTYVLPGGGTDPIEDTINPLNISNRKRDKLRAMIDWSPTDRLALQLALENAKDKYGGNFGPYGLQDGTNRLYTVDASYKVNSDWQVNAWVTRDETRANEITLLANIARFKYNDLSETGDSLGLGVKGQISSKLKVGGDVESFRSVNRYNQRLEGVALSASLVPPPDITNTFLKFKLFAQYAIQKNADLRFDMIHEKWSTNDWSWLTFPTTGGTAPFTYGNTNDGTTVLSNPKQNSTFISVRYIYKF